MRRTSRLKRTHFLRGFNRLEQQDKILLGLSAVLVAGGVYLAKFAPDPEPLHGLHRVRRLVRGLGGDVRTGGTVVSLRHPIMSTLWRSWRNMIQERRFGI